MIDARRQAYLEAMGFDVWVARVPAQAPGRLLLAAGQGSTLLVCARPEDRDTALAADIARAVGDEPGWAWPDPEDRPESPTLAQAIEDGLVTRVVVFGRETAERLMGEKLPTVLKSAAFAVAADLDELATRGTAKQALWKLLGQGDSGPAAA